MQREICVLFSHTLQLFFILCVFFCLFFFFFCFRFAHLGESQHRVERTECINLANIICLWVKTCDTIRCIAHMSALLILPHHRDSNQHRPQCFLFNYIRENRWRDAMAAHVCFILTSFNSSQASCLFFIKCLHEYAYTVGTHGSRRYRFMASK